MNTQVVIAGVALAVGLIGAIFDARTGRIPNWLTFGAAFSGVVLRGLTGGRAGVVLSIAGLLVAGLVPWLLYRGSRGRAIGGGDVKLFAALGAIEGPIVGLELELSACILLAVFAVVRLAFEGRLLRMLGNAARLVANPFLPTRWRRPLAQELVTEMRMGPAIFAAVVYVCFADRLARWAPWLA
jgi:prepilin peptidase CpaA